MTSANGAANPVETPQCTNGASTTGTTGTTGTPCEKAAGNPINIATGNKYQREVDMPALAGVLGLEIIRHYNSYFSGTDIPNGNLGRGWKLLYETDLYVSGKTLQVVQADGTRLVFNRDPLYPSRCSTANPANGTIVIRPTPGGNSYLWTQRDGRRMTFSALGKLEQIQIANGEFVSMQHDSRGHLLSADGRSTRPLVTDMDVRAFTGLAGFTHGNGLKTSLQHDRRTGQLTKLSTTASQPAAVALQTHQLGYDIGGRLTTITRNGTTEKYGYDGNDYLNRVDTPTEQVGWTYDLVGKRLAATALPSGTGTASIALVQALTYQPSSNRLQSVAQPEAQIAYDYDAAGNPVRIGTRSSVYGVTGRLIQVSDADKVVARYAYNAHSERIAKTVIAANGVATTTYFFCQGQQLDAEADGNCRVVAHHIDSGHIPLIKLDYPILNAQKFWWRAVLDWCTGWLGVDTDPRASHIYAIHTDHLGTPRSMTDAQQRSVWQATYAAFGKATVTVTATATLNLRFPGQYFDGETGGHYNYFSDDDPQTGRYIQSDPLGLNGGPNTYTYVGGNQLSFVDPLGLDRWGSYGYGRYIPSTNFSPSFREKLNFAETPEQRAFGQKLIDGFAGGICGSSKATTTLFRAVTEGEAAQIARTGTFIQVLT
ncbi:RHS repeat-associated core domain-containing protein [Actimicrobium antarcticum]|uniref:RHS repeat-associated core domain-containing protein n=1 Tax=Actimicrobium antarcticum TaxID=1051899 RepID=A0ABP7TP79_9BURK